MPRASSFMDRHVFWIMAFYVVVGMPFVAVLWESLNQMLALQFSPRLWLSLPAAAGFAAVLFALSRTLKRSLM